MSEIMVGVIGGGNMAEAIIRGGLNAGVLQGATVVVSEPRQERRAELESVLGVRVTGSNAEAVSGARMVLLAVKPQVVDAVMSEIGPQMVAGQLLVSVAAGVTIARLSKYCSSGVRIIRSMPNTPMLVGRGMVGLSRGAGAETADIAAVTSLFGSVADCLELPEEKLDAVTAISGSGPAYFFLLVECLAAAGERLGLTAEESARLARVTFTGAAHLLDESDAEAGELRSRVTSPGGTTAAALDAFAKGGFADLVQQAATAACLRSKELGKG